MYPLRKAICHKGEHFDSGEALEFPAKTVRGEEKVVTEGPFLEAKELVGGFYIIKAESLKHALELSKDVRFLMWSGGWAEKIGENSGHTAFFWAAKAEMNARIGKYGLAKSYYRVASDLVSSKIDQEYLRGKMEECNLKNLSKN